MDIHAAAEKGDVQRVKELISQDSKNLNKIKAFGHRFTPLHCAARWGHLEVVKALVEGKADINNKECGQTPLAVAKASESTYPDFDKNIVPYLSSFSK